MEGAGRRRQSCRLLLSKQYTRPVQVLAALTHIQLAAGKWPGKAADGPRAWAPDTYVGDAAGTPGSQLLARPAPATTGISTK